MPEKRFDHPGYRNYYIHELDPELRKEHLYGGARGVTSAHFPAIKILSSLNPLAALFLLADQRLPLRPSDEARLQEIQALPPVEAMPLRGSSFDLVTRFAPRRATRFLDKAWSVLASPPKIKTAAK